MTSNIGSHIIQEKLGEKEGWNDHLVVEETKEEVMALLKQSVRPEFLNRVDEVVMFEPLNLENMKNILEIQFKQIQKRLKEQNIELEASPEAIEKMAELGYDPVYGARPLKRVLQREVLNVLSKDILAGKIKKEEVIILDLDKDGQFTFGNVLIN